MPHVQRPEKVSERLLLKWPFTISSYVMSAGIRGAVSWGNWPDPYNCIVWNVFINAVPIFVLVAAYVLQHRVQPFPAFGMIVAM